MPGYAAEVTPMIAVGDLHTVALKADGTVWSWGYGADGQMGNNTLYPSPCLSPVQADITDVKYIAVGNANTFAIKTDGTLWAWGFNGNGELGLGDTASRSVPTQVTGLAGVIQVAGTNGGFTACLLDTGAVWAWGYNNKGQLGNGTINNSTVPVQSTASDFADIREIDLGSEHVVARKDDGTVWTWGNNGAKQCGRGVSAWYTQPGQVTTAGVSSVTKVKAGAIHTVVLKNDGTVWTWGSNKYGQLGKGYPVDGDDGEYANSRKYDPAQVPGLADIADIQAGGDHTTIKKNDGTIWSVGMNMRGEFGDGNCLFFIPYGTEEFRQALVAGPYLQMETFVNNTGFLKTDGTLWTCGANSMGQLGNGSTSLYVDIPYPVPCLNLLGGAIIPGDVDGSGAADLADAIQILQVVSGASPAPVVCKNADVNNDAKIGLAEAIFCMEAVAGLRH